MSYQTTRIEDYKDAVIINTNQNPKKIGSLVIPKSQLKEDFFATINQSEDLILPVISLSKETSKDQNVFRIKASSLASAQSKAIKEFRKRYLRYNNLNLTTSNLHFHVNLR